MAPFAAINYIRYGIGYDEFLKEYAQYRKIKVEELYDLLREIQESAKGYKTFQEWFDSMDAYKEKLKEQSEKDAPAGGNRCIYPAQCQGTGI